MTEFKDSKNIITRSPVVVVLGHVDHGKSSLLETIKDLKITTRESGGITQHVGAYEIEHQGKRITFIDTPGHEAFSNIRSRGARVADIAVLVIAAEEGVKPQTKEAIKHIKEAGIPMIVAINKIDKPEADPEKVKLELAKEDVLVESIGGKVPSVNVSAKTKQGITDLLEIISLLAEIENLKADVSKKGEGVVIESYLDSNRGPTATLILRNGVLKKGDVIGTFSSFGKIRIMEDFQGNSLDKALPSMPVVVVGFEAPPGVGENFQIFEDIEAAKSILKTEKKKKGLKSLFSFLDFSRENLKDNQEIINLIIKADVIGSLEAIKNILEEVVVSFNKNKEEKEIVRMNVLKADIGEINESDVKLAISGKAKIIGFRVKVNNLAKKLAEREKITIIVFEVIYDLAQAIRNLLEKKVKPKEIEIELGEVKILSVFRTEKKRQIVGGKVIKGVVRKSAFVKVVREEEKVGEGRIIELQKNKKKVEEVEKGSECGILYEGSEKIEEGDILKIYIKKKE